MERRNFIRLGVMGTAAGIIAPSGVLAGTKSSSAAGGVYYTKDAPGRWSKKVTGHLPHVEIDKSAGKIQVVTGHEMAGFEHYIVKHVLLDGDYNFMAENMFNPTKDKAPISTFDLNNYDGIVYALSMCNKHDVWLNMAEV